MRDKNEKTKKKILEETIKIVTGQRQYDYGDKLLIIETYLSFGVLILDKKYQPH